MHATEPANKSSLLGAFFLASSWTWVVGMWLPVILVGHFGWPGWVAFAVPNVAGAMSVGLLYRSRASSEAFVERHRGTMRWFSRVTLALHACVLTWAFSWLMRGVVSVAGFSQTLGATSIPMSTALAIGALVALWIGASWFGSRSFRAASIGAIVVWMLSVGALVLGWITMGDHSQPPAALGDAPFANLAFLAPVLVFGFALCPYLDLTIHRARQVTEGRAGDRAFVLGFGALFLAMIVGTLTYAQAWNDSRSISFYIAAHLALQSGFTIAMHLRALRDTSPSPRERPGATPLLVGMALGIAPSSALAINLLSGTPLIDLLSFDATYRVFMAFYGLLFPTLLWASTTSRRTDRTTTITALLCVLAAAPFFWLGFLEGEWFWLAPGLLIALVSGLAARRFSWPKAEHP